jgi:hypothetical protein
MGEMVAVGVSEGMAVGKSVGNRVLEGEIVIVGSSRAVAEGTRVLVGGKTGAGAALVLAGRQADTSTANANRSAETVKNRREASKLTFLEWGSPVAFLAGTVSSYYKD